MPGYLWITLVPAVALAAGFLLGHWLSHRNRIEDFKNFRDRLDKVAYKAGLIEKLLQPPDTKQQARNKAYNPKPDGPGKLLRDFGEVNDRLEKIISVLELKKGGESKPKAGSENKRGFDVSGFDDFYNSLPRPQPSGQTQSTPAKEDKCQTAAARPLYDQEPFGRLIQLYNLGVDDRAARDKFRTEYPITRLGNNKAIEQRLGEVEEPEFRKLDNGNFLAVPGAQGSFYVLPWFDSTLNSSAYNEGGFSHVFACPGYDPEVTYTVVRVKRPAVFMQDGDTWITVEKGELILQR